MTEDDTFRILKRSTADEIYAAWQNWVIGIPQSDSLYFNEVLDKHYWTKEEWRELITKGFNRFRT